MQLFTSCVNHNVLIGVSVKNNNFRRSFKETFACLAFLKKDLPDKEYYSWWCPPGFIPRMCHNITLLFTFLALTYSCISVAKEIEIFSVSISLKLKGSKTGSGLIWRRAS
jgi:hypothetical protein